MEPSLLGGVHCLRQKIVDFGFNETEIDAFAKNRAGRTTVILGKNIVLRRKFLRFIVRR